MGFKSKITMDLSGLKKVQRAMNKIAKTEVEWGWINGKAYNKGDINGRGGIPFALIAITNEFGGYAMNKKTSKYVYIPARPYFQQSVKQSTTYMKAEAGDVLKMALLGEAWQGKLESIAQAQVGIVKSSIAQNNMRSLHPMTIGIKGHGKQWHDTGQLIKNITAKVIYKRAGYQGD